MAELFHNFFYVSTAVRLVEAIHDLREKNEVVHIVLNQHGSLPDLLMLRTYVLCIMQVCGIV
jgi:hypothetical protein